jgi:gamma-glutamyltranspeptidase/glutathione hydrolase
VQKAVHDRTPIPINITRRDQTGTVHLSCVDRQGNMAALTLTHGNGFGACVTLDGLGLLLGHGMSRFEPKPGHPNSVAPGKRPLDNMCPTIVLRTGQPILALGASGGRRIPNSVLDVLVHNLILNDPLKESVNAPRFNTEGDLNLTVEAKWPVEEQEYLKTLGYTIKTGPGAVVSAVSMDPKTGQISAAWR